MKGKGHNRAVLPLYAAFINMSILPVTRPWANSGALLDVVFVPETPEVMIHISISIRLKILANCNNIEMHAQT